MIPVDLYWNGRAMGTFLLEAVPQVGHQFVVMDMEITGAPGDDPIHWVVEAVVWGAYARVPKITDSNLRCVEVQVVPHQGAPVTETKYTRALDAIYTKLVEVEKIQQRMEKATPTSGPPTADAVRIASLLMSAIDACKYMKQPEFDDKFGEPAAPTSNPPPPVVAEPSDQDVRKATTFLATTSRRNITELHRYDPGAQAEALAEYDAWADWATTTLANRRTHQKGTR